MAKIATLDDTRNWKKAEPFKNMDDMEFAEEVRRSHEYMKLVSDECARRGINIKNDPSGLQISKTTQL
jgi:hypothetical protein